MKDYSNAFTEVYEILNHLEKDAYDKIPTSLIKTIEENRNKEYEYILDEKVDLTEQPMLRETKAILFNIFRDYLCTPDQKEKIKRMQAEERRVNENIKRERYYKDKLTKEKTEMKNKDVKPDLELIKVDETETFWNKIKKFFNKLIKK